MTRSDLVEQALTRKWHFKVPFSGGENQIYDGPAACGARGVPWGEQDLNLEDCTECLTELGEEVA